MLALLAAITLLTQIKTEVQTYAIKHPIYYMANRHEARISHITDGKYEIIMYNKVVAELVQYDEDVELFCMGEEFPLISVEDSYVIDICVKKIFDRFRPIMF